MASLILFLVVMVGIFVIANSIAKTQRAAATYLPLDDEYLLPPDVAPVPQPSRAAAKPPPPAKLKKNVTYRRCDECDGYVEPRGLNDVKSAAHLVFYGPLAPFTVAAGMNGVCLNCDARYDPTNFRQLKTRAVARR